MTKKMPQMFRFRDETNLERSVALDTIKRKGVRAAVLTLGALLTLGTFFVDGSEIFAEESAGSAAAAATDSALSQNQTLLLRARHSLMGKDVASAERFVQEAAALAPNYGEADDRPEYVAALVREYKEALSLASRNGMNEATRRGFASSYLNQAEALRRCQDFDGADALVNEAIKLDVVLDAETIRNGMDAESVRRRVNDDRLAVEALRRASLPQSEPLVGLSEATKQQVAAVQDRVAFGRKLLTQGKMDEAERLARTLMNAGIPENAFGAGDSPTKLLGDIALTRSEVGNVASANWTAPATANAAISPVQGYELTPKDGESHGLIYLREADAALRAGNNEAALGNYRDALRYTAELDAETVKRINDTIVKLTNPVAAAPEPKPSKSGIDLNRAPQEIQADISNYIAKAYQIRPTEPNEALAMLKGLREEVEQSSLEAAAKNHFAYTLDTAIADTTRFIDVNGPMIALENKNKDVEGQIRQQREDEIQMQNRLAEDTEKFNKLLEDGKYEEAEILAKKCSDYSHGETVAVQMVHMARMSKQVAFNKSLKENREAGWLGAMNDVESASIINVSDANPMAYGPQWERAKNRKAIEVGSQRPEADLEILRKLDMRLTLPFDQPMPLATVLDFIGDSLKINVLQDEVALREAGITSDTPIETKLTNISLKNYLKNVLTPYNLTYVVENEVLKITSKSQLSGEPVIRMHYVGDLIVPIPDFNEVNSPKSLQSSFDRAFNNARRGGTRTSSKTIPEIANNMYTGTMLSPDVMAQISAAGNAAPISTGAGGGGSDPSELINLITSVVDPESWDSVGDPQFFTLNNSLIIRQNEANHQEIRDLLDKLRSMMDMQIAVEVRYLAINDEYFERIGVNFGATFKSSAPNTVDDDGYLVPSGKGVYGITSADAVQGKPFTDSLNVDFTQNSYGLTMPQFGNYDPSVGAQLGFAILSDIETYFFISASEADQRTNVMQAPKVMMFNGQMATVSDMNEVPYVYTVVPVVGDFAVAQQPVVTVVNEGQFMTVQAVVDPSRRYVRMTVAPFFSKITDSKREFKFDGSDTTITGSTKSTKGSESDAIVSDEREDASNSQTISTGTTIQQPVISQFTVSTTVMVPDGGTVMLGGIKRLSEGRSEGGVPLLSKIPYIKRLFSNTSIGRTTSSLMMMVTPRIIIQDEEEEYLTGLTSEDFKEGDGRPLK